MCSIFLNIHLESGIGDAPVSNDLHTTGQTQAMMYTPSVEVVQKPEDLDEDIKFDATPLTDPTMPLELLPLSGVMKETNGEDQFADLHIKGFSNEALESPLFDTYPDTKHGIVKEEDEHFSLIGKLFK